MIRWCSYCQTYIGEISPYDDYTLTHGICRKCQEDEAMMDGDIIAKSRQLGIYYATLQQTIREGNTRGFEDAFLTRADLDIQPVDFLIGILQPLLYEIGQLWSRGIVTVSQEHACTALIVAKLDMIHSSVVEFGQYKNSTTPVICLMSAMGNGHHVGLRMVELLLMLNRVPSHMVTSRDDVSNVHQTLRSLQPKYLGLSMALSSQIAPAVSFVKSAKKAGCDSIGRAFFGGSVFRDNEIDPGESDIIIVRDIRDLAGLLR